MLSLGTPLSGVRGWVGGALDEVAASFLLACPHDTPAGAAGRAWHRVPGPGLPDLPVLGRGWVPDLAWSAAGDGCTLDAELEVDPEEEEDCLVTLPAHAGALNRLFGLSLLGTGSDRWLRAPRPPAPGRPEVSRAIRGLSGHLAPRACFLFTTLPWGDSPGPLSWAFPCPGEGAGFSQPEHEVAAACWAPSSEARPDAEER